LLAFVFFGGLFNSNAQGCQPYKVFESFSGSVIPSLASQTYINPLQITSITQGGSWYGSMLSGTNINGYGGKNILVFNGTTAYTDGSTYKYSNSYIIRYQYSTIIKYIDMLHQLLVFSVNSYKPFSYQLLIFLLYLFYSMLCL
jgi:hypothetical protein